ncbi:MAG TPA: hypothetical protein VFZ52_14285 [Chryseolinea sp.]
MKTIFSLLLVVMLLPGCGESKQDNQALYDDVMKVHDEVMPRMDDIYSLKVNLKKQAADSSSLTDDRRKAIEAAILKLDAASEGMMVWMRNFNPLPDSLGEEKARLYLEEQQKQIENVRADMQAAIDEATALK